MIWDIKFYFSNDDFRESFLGKRTKKRVISLIFLFIIFFPSPPSFSCSLSLEKKKFFFCFQWTISWKTQFHLPICLVPGLSLEHFLFSRKILWFLPNFYLSREIFDTKFPLSFFGPSFRWTMKQKSPIFSVAELGFWSNSIKQQQQQ